METGIMTIDLNTEGFDLLLSGGDDFITTLPSIYYEHAFFQFYTLDGLTCHYQDYMFISRNLIIFYKYEVRLKKVLYK